MLNGDTYLDTDYRQLVRAHWEQPAALALGLATMPDAGRCGAVTLAADGYVTRFAEKSPADPGPGLVNAGVYAGSASVFADFPRLNERRLLRGVVVPGETIDIGTPVSYQQILAQRPDEI